MKSERAAFLFPGQGAQAIGMAKELLAASPRTRELFRRGSELAGEDLARLALEGPEERLNSTRISQPAIFLHSLAVVDALGESFGSREPFGVGLSAAAAAGLSLGEYSALVFAGSLEFDEALRLVVERGRAMQAACDAAPGGMVSLLGLPLAKVEEAVAATAALGLGRIGIANYNSPDQTVISGDAAALEAAARKASEAGCRRVIPLKVAGAYHSPLMAAATAKLAPILAKLTIRPPRCPFYSNVSGGRVSDPEEIRAGLLRQVESPVRWLQIVQRVIADGADEAIEPGPGKVIAGLVRNVDKGFKVTSIGAPEGVRALAAAG